MALLLLEEVFAPLKRILQNRKGTLSVGEDVPGRFSIEAPPGPATLRAWGGKPRRSSLPVAWVEVKKAYVSYHLMGVYGNQELERGMSKELKARRQGKTCFNLKSANADLFAELDQLTAKAIASFKRTGFISA